MKFLKRILLLTVVAVVILGFGEKFREGEQPSFVSFPTGFQDKKEQLKFSVMSDIHSDWENLKKALEQAKKDFGAESLVIITGDLTTLGLKSQLLEAKNILDASGVRYFVIPGNHDLWWGRKYKNNVWEEVFGASYRSFKESGVKFILINNGDGQRGLEGLGGDGQRGWLQKEIIECLKIDCLVFMHEPLNHPSSLHVMGEENSQVASEAAELINLLVNNQVKEVFAGHLHFSSSYELGGLKMTIVGAITRERNFQSPKFLEVRVKDGYLEKEDVFLSN